MTTFINITQNPALGNFFIINQVPAFSGISSIQQGGGEEYTGPLPEYWWKADSGLGTVFSNVWTPSAGGLDMIITEVGPDPVLGAYFNGTTSFGETNGAIPSNVDAKHIFIRYDMLTLSNNATFLGSSINNIHEVYNNGIAAGGGFTWYHVSYETQATLTYATRKSTTTIAPVIAWSDFGNGTDVREYNPYKSELLTVAGAGTWTKPAGVTEVLVECWGGGGAGGGATTTNTGGDGGAGGQYARKTITYGSAQQSISYSVAASVAGGTGNGVVGSDTTWETNVVVAKGGAGGLANQTTIRQNPTAGSSSGGVGDVVYAGGPGQSGYYQTVGFTLAEGGTGGAGASSQGAPLAVSPTTTRVPELGGDGGLFGSVISGGANGSTGTLYASGGGGAAKISGPNRSGGAGAQGLIRVSYATPSQPSDTYSTYAGTFNNRFRWTAGQTIQFGRRQQGERFHGYIKEIAIFTTNLTQAQGEAFRAYVLSRWPAAVTGPSLI